MSTHWHGQIRRQHFLRQANQWRKWADRQLTERELKRILRGIKFGKEAVKEIERGGLGTTVVLNSQNTLSGIITDGDIRRMVASGKRISKLTVEDVMTRNPRTLRSDSPAFEALNMMERHQITVIPVINSAGEVQGILHLHDILGKGEFKFNGT